MVPNLRAYDKSGLRLLDYESDQQKEEIKIAVKKPQHNLIGNQSTGIIYNNNIKDICLREKKNTKQKKKEYEYEHPDVVAVNKGKDSSGESGGDIAM